MAQSAQTSPPQGETLPPLPFGRDHWQAIVDFMGLSTRQAEIAELMVRGAQLKEIAAELGIKACTIRGQQERMYGKIGVRGSKEFFVHLLGVSYRLSIEQCGHK
jgi:DNA-binding CsgD family transcriptional regulator